MDYTPEERVLLSKQQHELQGVSGAICECQCGEMFNILDMYRCLYCGIYRCIDCSEKHFGMTVCEWKES